MVKLVFVKKEFFRIHNDFIEMLDPTNIEKQSQRSYVFLSVKYKKNNILVPLRRVLPDLKTVGKIGYTVPSETRKNAGLDYRKILIINDMEFIESPKEDRIPNSQQEIIDNNYNVIEKEVKNYIDGYIKSVKKRRQFRDGKYRFSTLHNFHRELGVEIGNKEITKVLNDGQAIKSKGEEKN